MTLVYTHVLLTVSVPCVSLFGVSHYLPVLPIECREWQRIGKERVWVNLLQDQSCNRIYYCSTNTKFFSYSVARRCVNRWTQAPAVSSKCQVLTHCCPHHGGWENADSWSSCWAQVMDNRAASQSYLAFLQSVAQKENAISLSQWVIFYKCSQDPYSEQSQQNTTQIPTIMWVENQNTSLLLKILWEEMNFYPGNPQVTTLRRIRENLTIKGTHCKLLYFYNLC